MYLLVQNFFYFFQQVNTFQLVLASNGTISFAAFLYRTIQWGAGIAGFDAADNQRFFMLPGSLTTRTRDFPAEGNIHIPGAYMFRIDSRRISFPPRSKESLRNALLVL